MNEKGTVVISAQDALNKKIQQMRKAGIDSIHVVSDFDQTLTKRLVEGKKLPSVYAELNKYLGAEYSAKERILFDTYYPYETNPSIPMNVKCEKMLEWWQLHLQLMMEYSLDKQTLHRVAKHRELSFRDNTNEFFSLLATNKIPFLIFSAGLGDVITDVLQLDGMLTKNIHVISNVFDFDEHGKVTGYKNHIIHSFNKNEVEVKHHPYHKEVEKRKNVILLGDMIEDLGMIAGIHHDCVISIGFLNEKVDERLDAYTKAFDIVILHDGSMEKAVWLVKEILR
ncbi:hypothetical protein HYS47_00545 [Candidatus Woesearchaeota archaeon]|nr:hypothetical protein [Candidatus Woesearchaeota archaeon]